MSEKISTIIDNSGGQTILAALQRILPESIRLDIATGYFEISALLALGTSWRGIDHIRIVMGDETTRRTRQLLLDALNEQTDQNLETHKEQDDSLAGLDLVRQALRQMQIEVRVYDRAKFHAKCYLMKTRPPQLANFGLIGSSNFTVAGLTSNVELNLCTSDSKHLQALWEWYEAIWNDSKTANAEILRVIERHARTFSPHEVWAKALHEYFLGREKPATYWDEHDSIVYPILSKYQQDGYRAALKIAERWGGAFVCDGVGLGKTFVGLMLLEYHLHRGDRILLIVPKSARESVWEAAIRRYLRPRYRFACEANLQIHNQTDFGREGTIADDRLDYYRDYYKVVLVDEAHHFRTSYSNRSKALRALCDGGIEKSLYFLTATPINNSLLDLYHLINFIARDRVQYFSPLGIQNLRLHFSDAERRLEELFQQDDRGIDLPTAVEKSDFLRTDQLLKALVIQRSRAYVKETEKSNSMTPLFPEREKPRVIPYSLKKVYAGLYGELRAAFDKNEPLLSLAIYNPESFRRGRPDEQLINRNKQVIGLIRTLLLKRLESSYKAFEASLEELLRKMAAFISMYDYSRWTAWQTRHAKAWEIIQQHQKERQFEEDITSEPEEGNEFEDVAVAELPAQKEDYNLVALITAIEADMTLLIDLLSKVHQFLSPQTDDKLHQLLVELKNNDLLKREKVVIFTEFRDTARYLWKELKRQGLADIDELDSTRKVNRDQTIKRFAPNYNCDEAELPRFQKDQIRILISTDVLSEGLNLQDAHLIVNYDLHWNPVRLMQRIGRVDRRLNPEIERRLGRAVPLKVHIFNFLPPNELEELLGLYRRVTGKLLRISKTLGIEAPVLTPEDEFEALRLLNETCEKYRSAEEELHLELAKMHKDYPGLFEELIHFPRRIFSGRRADAKATRGLFCCYRFPVVQKPSNNQLPLEATRQTDKTNTAMRKEEVIGDLRWYFRVAETGEVWETGNLAEIANAIRSRPDTQRVVQASTETLKQWREEIEHGPVARYLRDLQAPMGVKPTLVCWMEVC